MSETDSDVYIGLDLGTSGLKGVALAPDGTVAARDGGARPAARPALDGLLAAARRGRAAARLRADPGVPGRGGLGAWRVRPWRAGSGPGRLHRRDEQRHHGG